jgi:hypothetical protein
MRLKRYKNAGVAAHRPKMAGYVRFANRPLNNCQLLIVNE